ncbi:MAG: TonB C-terminal domain-containing protein, partial [Myxococcales bacterium]|nr:TonB C-terminal domain-containing protein [Myxococcales bacterium]
GNGQRAGGDNGGARAASGAETPEYETLTVQDGSGSFVIRVPKERGERDHARLSDAHGHGDSGAGSGAGAEGRSPRGGLHGEGGGLHHNGPQLALSWRSFLDSVNEDELREDRERYVEERKSRLRGGERQKLWKEFRAAIENFVPSVKPGNQTALNAAASPFANYLTAVHRRIHREYAYEFLAGLPIGGTSPFADPNLVTELEIILNRNGTIHRVGVVSPSGLLAFDYGAWAAVMRGQPYPEAPPQILSGDGRVYFHWGFYRNERQCGTFNAEPYILPNPPGSPAPSPGLDGPLPGGIVPRDSEPTWGTENERSGRNDAAPPGDRVRATLDVAPSRRGS